MVDGRCNTVHAVTYLASALSQTRGAEAYAKQSLVDSEDCIQGYLLGLSDLLGEPPQCPQSSRPELLRPQDGTHTTARWTHRWKSLPHWSSLLMEVGLILYVGPSSCSPGFFKAIENLMPSVQRYKAAGHQLPHPCADIGHQSDPAFHLVLFSLWRAQHVDSTAPIWGRGDTDGRGVGWFGKRRLLSGA